ncbi:anti-sigma factor domain-containing protein [Demequina activiva]|uniref:Regulator of SigK n=1 Tax=Demequina activiva TaxID=1582364 RepID=A0A919PZN2_9MICO|nr:anti-sigma factor [Demequina activiva]GIG53377.1 hypothetical protein Dac01nite_01290 [Demequina activiva]
MNPHEMVGAYALHALDEDEARAFELHLETCAECREELASFDVVLDELAEPGAEEPPSAVDPAILDATLSPERRARLDAAVSAAVGSTEQVPAPQKAAHASAPEPMPTTLHAPARRRGPGTRLLAAAAAVVAVLAVGVGFILGTGGEENTLAADIERIQDASDVVETSLGLGEATAYVSATEGVAVVGDTPELDGDRTYQLWVVPADGSAPVPGPVMAGGDSEAVWDADLDGAAAIAVSIEPTGGSTTPTEVVTAVEV